MSSIPSANSPAYLLAIVEVDKHDRVRCQAEGCGHSVYRRIHVVLIGAEFKVFGSQCYQRLYGNGEASPGPHYGSEAGRLLTQDERQMLVENTARFIESLEAERLVLEARAAAAAEHKRQMEAQERARQAEQRAREEQAQVARRNARSFSPDAFATSAYEKLGANAAQYEHSEQLRWKWKNQEILANRLALLRTHPPIDPAQSLVLRYMANVGVSPPYPFALQVEARTKLPKPRILRALHELDLIERF